MKKDQKLGTNTRSLRSKQWLASCASGCALHKMPTRAILLHIASITFTNVRIHLLHGAFQAFLPDSDPNDR